MQESEARRILGALGVRVVAVRKGWLQAHCPFAQWTHSKRIDRNPSFGVKVEENGISSYSCYTCKRHGRVSSLVRSLEKFRKIKYTGLAFDADVADATRDFNADLSYKIEGIDTITPLDEDYADLYDPAYDVKAAREYLEGRGVSKDTAEHLGIGYDPDDRRVVFPVRNGKGELFGYTGRSILDEGDYPAHYSYSKVRDYLGLPKRHLLLGAEFVADEPELPILVVEGLFGYAHLMELGADEYCSPVALMGSAMTPGKRDTLIGWGLPVYLVLDNDQGGDIGLYGVVKDLQHVGGGAVDQLKDHLPLFIPSWPKDKKDPDELTLSEIKAMLRTSQYFS